MVEVIDKRAAGDRFVRDWSSFDPVTAGQTIGVRADGSTINAGFDGMILFPDAAAGAGHEWFYLTRPNPNFHGN
jgi:hypothetical protein